MLQFSPDSFFRVYQQGQDNQEANREQSLNAISQLGQGVNSYQQNQRQRAMSAFQSAIAAKSAGMNPDAIYKLISGNNAPTVPGTDSQPQVQPQAQPSFASQSPQLADAGMSDTGGDPGIWRSPKSPVIDAWNNHPNISQFAPKSQPQTHSIFQTQPVDYGKVNADLASGDPTSLFHLPEKERATVEKLREFKIRQDELNQKKTENPDYDPQDLVDAQSGNFKGIASRHGGVIPHGFASLAETASGKADAAYEKKRLDAQNAMINVRGDQSIARTEAQRDAASMAYNTIERVKGEGRMPSKLESYDLLGQMWKARTGASPTDQALKDLDQKTLQGDLGKAYTYFSGKTAGATTGEILQNLQDFISESGVQSDKQHEAYMGPRQSKILNGLKSEDQQSLMNVHRGMSFQDQTGYKPRGSGLMWNGRALKDTPANRAWLETQKGGKQ